MTQRERERESNLAESELVVILIIEHMQEIRVEGMDSLKAGELVNDAGELLVEVLLREPHLAHVELTQARDRIPLVHHRRRLSLRARQDDVNHLLPRRDHRYPLEIELHHRFLPSLPPPFRDSVKLLQFELYKTRNEKL